MNFFRRSSRAEMPTEQHPVSPQGPVLNVDLLLAVKRKVIETSRVDMRGWQQQANKESLCIAQHLCGTVYCIGGWAIMLSGGHIPDSSKDTFFAARTLLGLSEQESRLLFWFHSTQEGPYALLCAKALIQKPRTPEYASVVGEAIDLCIQRNATPEQKRQLIVASNDIVSEKSGDQEFAHSVGIQL